MRLFCDEIIPLPIVANDIHNPPHYQISEKVKELCLTRGIPPDEFLPDATGIGSGVLSNLKVQWSPRVEGCIFGGAPSDTVMSDENPVPANKECDRKVTELWMRARYFVEADMVRGLDQKTAVQLCSRTLDDKGVGGSRKQVIQKKEEMLHSPDEADAFVLYLELLRRKGILPKMSTVVTETHTQELVQVMEEMDFDASPDAYSDPLLDSFEEMFTF